MLLTCRCNNQVALVADRQTRNELDLLVRGTAVAAGEAQHRSRPARQQNMASFNGAA